VPRYYVDRKGRRLVMANLSRNHPDWGKTPAEHEERKALRAAGKLPFIPKGTRPIPRLGRAR
jgi:hypothetical protein